MLYIKELRSKFSKAGFFSKGSTYNKLFVYAEGVARTLDARTSRVESLEKESADTRIKVSGLKGKITRLTKEIEQMEIKYKGAVLRDPKTGSYLKRK